MTETPDLKAYLDSLRKDMKAQGQLFRSFAGHVIEQGISAFPVFIASGIETALGRPFMNKKDHGLAWNYNVSFLEDLMSKGLVHADKGEEFREAYGDPSERACIFLVIGDSGSFVFIPYSN